MKIEQGKFKGMFEITPIPHLDSRGFLMRMYDQETFNRAGIDRRWVQESWSHTQRSFTLRGLHVQLPPHTETKLISIVRGEMKWIVVDVRKGSDTFGQWDSVLLSSDQGNSLFVEAGFAHGCLSISDNCDLLIKSDTKFIEGKGTGIVWDDASLDINWGVGEMIPLMSERDRCYSDFESFRKEYGGL